MLALLAVVSLGFSLEGHGRQLADNGEVCTSGCDAGHDSSCDEQDSYGKWTRGCDMHPTTSCDEDCHYSPPPPRAPWLGEHGSYPSPPPPPPPVNNDPLVYAGTAALVAFIFLCCVCVMACYGTGRGLRSERVAYWCCACLAWRRNENSWYYDEDERKEDAALARAAAQQEAEELSLTGVEAEVGEAFDDDLPMVQRPTGVATLLPSLNHLK